MATLAKLSKARHVPIPIFTSLSILKNGCKSVKSFSHQNHHPSVKVSFDWGFTASVSLDLQAHG
ncbi:hypothetical protein Hanom_Chr10g00946991 [Helianthus anomalus]